MNEVRQDDPSLPEGHYDVNYCPRCKAPLRHRTEAIGTWYTYDCGDVRTVGAVMPDGTFRPGPVTRKGGCDRIVALQEQLAGGAA